MTGQPTVTRTELRHAICRKLRFPFFRKFGGVDTLDTQSDATEIVQASLTEKENFWRGSYVYTPAGGAAGDVRQIVAFTAENNTLIPERNFSGTPSGDYEIHPAGVNAFDIHHEINSAIRDGRDSFWEQKSEETLIIQEDTLEYDLSELTASPAIIHKIWLETAFSVIRGITDSSTSTTLTDDDADFSDVVAGWLMSIYDGTGKGQLRTVDSVSGQQVTNTVAWTTDPDTTSKYIVWDPDEQDKDWYRVLAARFDSPEYPTKLYLTRDYFGHYGMRIRIEFSAQPSILSAEADTTVVPEEFIIDRALAKLHGLLSKDTRADRARHEREGNRHWEMSEHYRQINSWNRPSSTLWLEFDGSYNGSYTSSDGNPLAW